MPNPKEHAARLEDPADFQPGSFRRREIKPGLHLILGRRLNSKSLEGQAYRFDASKFSAAAARAWLAEKGIKPRKFEPAEEEAHAARISEAEDGTYDLTDVEVLDTVEANAAKGGKIKFIPTGEPADDRTIALDRLVEDTQANLEYLKPPAKLGHGEQISKLFPEGGAPAFGWINAVRAQAGKVLVGFTKVPGAFKDALAKGRWRTRSVELIRNWRHPKTGEVFPAVIKAVAWLGAEMPAVQSLEDLLALRSEDNPETSLWLEFDDTGDPTDPAPDAGARPQGGTPTDGEGDRDPEPSNEPKDPHREEPMPENTPDATAALQAAQAERDEALRIADEAKRNMVEAAFSQALTERRLTAGQATEEKTFALELDFTQAKKYCDQLLKRPQAPDDTKPIGDTTPPETPPAGGGEKLTGEAKLMADATALVKDGTCKSYGDALVLAAAADPTNEEAFHLSYGLTTKSDNR